MMLMSGTRFLDRWQSLISLLTPPDSFVATSTRPAVSPQEGRWKGVGEKRGSCHRVRPRDGGMWELALKFFSVDAYSAPVDQRERRGALKKRARWSRDAQITV